MGRWALVGRAAGPGARQIPHHRNLLYGDQLEYFLNSLQGVFSPLSPAVDRCHGLCSDSHSPGRHSGSIGSPRRLMAGTSRGRRLGERGPLCHTHSLFGSHCRHRIGRALQKGTLDQKRQMSKKR